MLVIFDCDGVLVDSERLGAEVFSSLLYQYGYDFSVEMCLEKFKGKTLTDCFLLIETEFSKTLPEEFEQALIDATRNTFSKCLKAVEGIEDILSWLKDKNIKFCVASNGGQEKVINSLTTVNLIHYFENHIFSADNVEKGKPSPDLFLWAANEMKEDVAHCCVVEDSVSGVNAALSANMKVIHFDESFSESERSQLQSNGQWRASLVTQASSIVEVFDELKTRVKALGLHY